MSKPPLIHPDPLVMKVRKLLNSMEPRKTPTKTKVNDYGHTGWECPYCGVYCPRRDRTVYKKGRMEKITDYASYNMHFAHMHGESFWVEQQLIKLIKRSR